MLVVIGPVLKRRSAHRTKDGSDPGRRGGLSVAVGLTGIYGGYFGAAQGVILLASLTALLPGDMQRANAFKIVLAGTANLAAAVVFTFTTTVAWPAAFAIAIGAILGGQLGGLVGQHLPASVFRVVIVAIGLCAVIYFVIS